MGTAISAVTGPLYALPATALRTLSLSNAIACRPASATRRAEKGLTAFAITSGGPAFARRRPSIVAALRRIPAARRQGASRAATDGPRHPFSVSSVLAERPAAPIYGPTLIKVGHSVT